MGVAAAVGLGVGDGDGVAFGQYPPVVDLMQLPGQALNAAISQYGVTEQTDTGPMVSLVQYPDWQLELSVQGESSANSCGVGTGVTVGKGVGLTQAAVSANPKHTFEPHEEHFPTVQIWPL